MQRGLRYLTTGQVAEACEVSLVTVKKWITHGKIRAFQTPGGHFRVTAEEFERFGSHYGFLGEAGHPPKILVVDDEPGIVALVSEGLRGLRPEPKLEAAFDGYEGILKVGIFRPDLLILDLRMPGLDGLQVCRRVKSQPSTRRTKILAITAYPEEFVRERVLQAGADGFLAKPFTLKSLKAEVRRLFRA